jgi:peptidoglycan/LPS O-acetylase OafA/YrhL
MPINRNTALQGLRAIAVIMVVLYHLEISGFKGGYLGVDIFFVLSGFIIFKLNYEKLKSLKDWFEFLKRRIFRIYPALFVVCTISIFAAVTILPPPLLEQSAKHYLSALTFVSNFVFRSESGYFDVGSDLKPFLHTWSLSLEWQAYILGGLLIVMLSRLQKKVFMRTVLLGTGLSLTFTLILSEHKNLIFFMLPFRVWEFGLGILAAHLSDRNVVCVSNEILRFRGVIEKTILTLLLSLVILLPLYSFEHDTLHAFIVCLLTATYLALIGNRNNLLNWYPIQFLGNISYSVYLIHWPLIVIYTYYVFREINIWEKVTLLFVTVGLATVSYRYIEEVFKSLAKRQPQSTLVYRITRFGITFILLGLSLGVALMAFNGLPQRYNYSERHIFEYFAEQTNYYRSTYQDKLFPEGQVVEAQILVDESTICSFDKISLARNNYYDNSRVAALVGCIIKKIDIDPSKHSVYLVVGDSNGLDVYRALQEAFPLKRFVMLMQSGCAPQDHKRCFPNLEEIIRRSMEVRNFDGVILSARYSQQDVSKVKDTLELLRVLDMQTLVIGPSMVLRRNIDETYIFKSFDMNQLTVTVDFESKTFVSDSVEINSRLRLLASSFQISYFDRLAAFCPEQRCYLRKGESPLLIDSQHLSISGIGFLAEALAVNQKVKVFFGGN